MNDERFHEPKNTEELENAERSPAGILLSEHPAVMKGLSELRDFLDDPEFPIDKLVEQIEYRLEAARYEADAKSYDMPETEQEMKMLESAVRGEAHMTGLAAAIKAIDSVLQKYPHYLRLSR